MPDGGAVASARAGHAGALAPRIRAEGQGDSAWTCIVHLVRHSPNFCSWKDRKSVATGLRRIYGAVTADSTADLAADELGPVEIQGFHFR